MYILILLIALTLLLIANTLILIVIFRNIRVGKKALILYRLEWYRYYRNLGYSTKTAREYVSELIRRKLTNN